MTILVTGATGRAGWHVARILRERGQRVRAAASDAAATGPWDETASFSFTDPATWDAAFSDVDRMFLMRPPQIGNVRRDMLPALRRARELGVRRMVLLSLQGAEHNPVVPHHDLEKWLRSTDLEWTFVRAAFFMQNLSTSTPPTSASTPGSCCPPDRGGPLSSTYATSPRWQPWRSPRTGTPGRRTPRRVHGALTYAEVADLISAELGRTVRYVPAGPLRYLKAARADGMTWGMALVTLALYITCRFGMADGLTDDVPRLLGRPPIDFTRFVRDERAAWLPARGIDRSLAA